MIQIDLDVSGLLHVADHFRKLYLKLAISTVPWSPPGLETGNPQRISNKKGRPGIRKAEGPSAI
jgi:hypothetical protein